MTIDVLYRYYDNNDYDDHFSPLKATIYTASLEFNQSLYFT